MFASEDEIDSRIICHTIIKKPLGPEQCFLLKKVTDKEAYEFNLFYKYLCLVQEDVGLDLDASICLKKESIELKNFS